MAEEEVEVLLKRINIKSKKKKLNPTEIRSIVRSIAYLLTDKFLEDGEKKTILCDALGGKMSAIYDYGQRQKDEGIKEGMKEGIKKMVKYMIKEGKTDKEIQKETGLSLNEIQKIKNNN